MANIRVKDLDSKASFASDDEILMDSPSGTGTMLRDAFIAAVASQIVAAPSTYKIATLDGADKLTSSQDPSQSVSYLGGHDMVANSPALADGSGTAGDTYYVTNPGTRNYGSGNITAQEGDALVYSGSVWQLVEGIANILDGISTASTARTTLEVNSIDEDAQANALKTTAPALYLNGSSSYVQVADDAKLSFTDGTDDLPFSLSAWVNMDDATGFRIAVKDDESSSREWSFVVGSSDKLNMAVIDTSGNYEGQISSAALTSYEGKWIHVCGTYTGCASASFATAATFINLYVNGQAVAMTEQSSGVYTGQSNTVQPVYIGRSGSSFAKGSIRDVKIFNRELTAAEVAELARGNDLGFSEEWGGALGSVETSDFSAGTDGYAASGGTVAGNIDGIGGVDDTIRLTLDNANSIHYFSQSISAIPLGKRCRVEGDFYVSSANSNVDGINFGDFIAGGTQITPSPDTWEHHTLEGVASGQIFRIYATDGGAFTFTDSGGDDVIYAKNLKITQIGTLADFRAERYDTSTNKLYDISDNAFVGTGTSVTLTGREVPVYETGTWTPSISFGGGSTGITYSAQEGVYTRIGNTCFVTGVITLSAVGSDTGTARLAGLPFVNHNMTATSYGSSSVVAFDMTGLTSAVNLLNEDNQPNAILYGSGATGATAVTHANFTATSSLRFSMTYQIQ